MNGGTDVRLAHWLPGKPAEEQAPHCPFDELVWWRCSDINIRTIISWGLEQVCKKFSHVSRL